MDETDIYGGFGAVVLDRGLPFIHERGAWTWDRTWDPALHRNRYARRALDAVELRALRDMLQRSLDAVERQIATGRGSQPDEDTTSIPDVMPI